MQRSQVQRSVPKLKLYREVSVDLPSTLAPFARLFVGAMVVDMVVEHENQG